MQAAIIGWAIRYRGVVVALALLLAGYGAWSLGGAKYDVFPEFAPPQVGIQTEAPGLAPEQVEALVTRPLENAVNGAPGVKKLRSTSIQGLSVITVLFDPGSDIYRDRQVVAERLAGAAAELPQGVKAPEMTPLTSSTSTVLVIGLTSAKRSLMDLRDAARWTVRPRVLAVPGVAKVAVFGGDERSIQVQVHPDALVRYGLGLEDVLEAARRATGVRGAGFVDTGNQRILLETRGQSLSAADVGRTVLVSRDGASITLASVADVLDAPEPPIGGATVEGRPGVVMDISAQYGANTAELTHAVEGALGELVPTLAAQGIALHPDLFRPANFIATATGNVRDSLALGGILVVVVVLLFLFNLRSAAISCAAIPLSLLAAVLVLERMGATLNTMTLGGLAISIGVVVDDAVIGVENIVRRLRENQRRAAPRPAARVVLEACLEVRSAIVYATFAVILVVLPVMTLSGIAGRMFAPLGLAYVLAVLASLAVALTVTPALATALIARRGLPEAEPPLALWTRKRYQALLARIARHPKTLIAAALAFTAAGCAALPFFGASFIPELKEGHFIVHMAAVPGTSIAESMRIGARVDRALLALPAVRSAAQHVGRAELADDTWGPNYSEFEVDLKPGLTGDEARAAEAEIRRALAGFVGVNFAVNTFLTERIEETLSGYTAPVAVKIFGDDLDVLEAKAGELTRILREMPGAADVQLASPPGLPQVTIALRRADVARWGFDPLDVLERIRTAYQGDVVGQAYQGNRVYNVITILDAASRADIGRIRALTLRSPGGVYVPLGRIADVYQGAGRYQVLHEGARRVQTVTANVRGTDVASFVAAARRAVAAKLELPPGSYVEFTGAAQAERRSRLDLAADSLIAGLGIVLLLSVVTHHWRNLALVLANLPFALVGGVLAVLAIGGELSLGALVGFVALFGISLRNSILMIDHYERLVGAEGLTWSLSTAIRGAADRLTPILMTSIVTGLGVLPLALGLDAPGREIEGPMAVVILGGLLTSMALNLLVLPTLALRYGRFEARA
jgi:CzcA family heavy metal efflux pump